MDNFEAIEGFIRVRPNTRRGEKSKYIRKDGKAAEYKSMQCYVPVEMMKKEGWKPGRVIFKAGPDYIIITQPGSDYKALDYEINRVKEEIKKIKTDAKRMPKGQRIDIQVLRDYIDVVRCKMTRDDFTTMHGPVVTANIYSQVRECEYFAMQMKLAQLLEYEKYLKVPGKRYVKTEKIPGLNVVHEIPGSEVIFPDYYDIKKERGDRMIVRKLKKGRTDLN